MAQPEEFHDAYFLVYPDVVIRDDVFVGSAEWYNLVASGRLFPVSYEQRYFESVKGPASFNDTGMLLLNSGFLIEAISSDHLYLVVTRPKTYGYSYGHKTCTFIRDEAGHYEELHFDIIENKTQPHQSHALYATPSPIISF